MVSAGDVLGGVAYAPRRPEAGGVAVEGSESELMRITDGARDVGVGAVNCSSSILRIVGRSVSGGGVTVVARKV